MLGIKIDSNLNFEEHVSTLCRKANQKLHALARISKYIGPPKRRIIMKAFVTSQFNYCPLVWMCHSRTLNNKINYLHERALRIAYNDKVSTFQELLNQDKSVTIHIKNIQILATEIYKVKNGMAPAILNDVFSFNNSPVYSLRSGDCLNRTNTRTTHYGIESISNIGAKIWNILPNDIKISPSLNIFKRKIKQWVPECPCRLCKTYIENIGFIVSKNL